jgi:preprotein translocase subunit SecE
MNTKAEASSSLDSIMWGIVLLLAAGGIVGFYYFEHYPLPLRVFVLLIIAALAAYIATKTTKGRGSVEFLREAHLEVRKVVWPSRQETLQTTGVVILMVVIVALLVWFLDSILLWIVRLLTNQGG